MKSIKQILLNKRMFVVLILGFSSGLPLSLTGSTLQAWMQTEKVDLKTIGLFSLVGLPYTLKFLWAPLMDRYIPPFLGRRRGWMAITQLGLFLGLVAMAFSNPTQSQAALASFAFFVAFASASQDIVVDAYRTEVLQKEEYGIGSAASTFGYRMAMLFSGAIALILSDYLSWKLVYLTMATAMGVGFLASFFGPEPTSKVKPPKSLVEAVIDPLKEILTRKGSFSLLTFIVLYKLDVVVAMALMTPFIMSLGFSRTDIGAVTKGFGLVATILGTFAGGAWMTRLGLHKSLWTFGILQGISGICFFLLARIGYNYPMMVTTIAAENFFSGMGNAVYSAFLMSLCNPRFTATQFALLTSLMALTRTVVGAPTGWLAETLGWESYFLVSILLMIPGLLLLTQFKKWTR